MLPFPEVLQTNLTCVCARNLCLFIPIIKKERKQIQPQVIGTALQGGAGSPGHSLPHNDELNCISISITVIMSKFGFREYKINGHMLFLCKLLFSFVLKAIYWLSATHVRSSHSSAAVPLLKSNPMYLQNTMELISE